MPSLRASLLARHSAFDAELTRRRQLVLADLNQPAATTAPARPLLATLWCELVAPFRPAWAALACIWLLLLSFAAADHTAQNTGNPAHEIPPLVAWSERERALAALLVPAPPVVLDPPRGTPTSLWVPRSAIVTAV
jgi:hypothetical protein